MHNDMSQMQLAATSTWHKDGSLTIDQAKYLENKVELYQNLIGNGKASTPLPTTT